MRVKIAGMVLLLYVAGVNAQQPIYKQASASVEDRIEDLLDRMTLEEKVGQICCPLGWEMYTKVSSDSVTISELFKKQMSAAPLGSYWAVLRACLLYTSPSPRDRG